MFFLILYGILTVLTKGEIMIFLIIFIAVYFICRSIIKKRLNIQCIEYLTSNNSLKNSVETLKNMNSKWKNTVT